MGDLDPEKESQKEDREADEELESLSAEEKAAFEKIMAEISAVSGSATPEKGAARKNKTAATQSSPAQSESPAPAAATSAGENQPVAEEEEKAGEQADFNKIMAEIESKRKGEKLPTKNTPEQDEENLSGDQQAALDQIMAEIDSKRRGEKTGDDQTSAEKSEQNDLPEDQQAALNQIMADIESKRKGQKNAAPGATEDAETAELTDPQQDALNRIMSEIESKRSSGKTQSTAASDDGAQTEAQPPDIEKIMAEIEAQKLREVKKAAPAAASDPQEEDPQKQDGAGGDKTQEKTSLTMEEFDDELNHLLSATKKKPAGNESEEAEAAQIKTHRTRADGKSAQNSAPLSAAPAEPLPVQDDEVAEVPQDYPVLHEVQVETDSSQKRSAKRTKTNGARPKRRRLRSLAFSLLIVLTLAGVSGGAYLAYQRYFSTSAKTHTPFDSIGLRAETEVIRETVREPAATAPPLASPPAALPVPPKEIKPLETPAMILAGLKNDLSSARSRIQQKIADIEQLKSYYIRGVHEEAERIEEALPNGQPPSLEGALADRKIELGLRAIQRRKTYVAKLEIPLAQIGAMSEELLYLERRTQVYEILNNGIGGLPIEKFRKDVSDAIGSHLQYLSQLSIDDVDVQAPALALIWEEQVAKLAQRASLLAQRAPLNRAVGAEICKGKYDRKYLLTALSEETAKCLIRWSGKDMYLNGLTELTPEAAKMLVQWPGEWLSLNGVKELSAETAKILSQWPGRRLSLNGLSILSPEATDHLSQWRGTQLEMIGLRAIGPWKNYATRLFLSEKLRLQLEAQ